VPAGFSGPNDKYGTKDSGKPYGGDPFEDEDGPSAYDFSAPPVGPYSRAKRGRWATFKENHFTDVDWTFGVNSLLGRKSKFDGVPREISLNDPAGNKVKGFENNSVSTGKYGPITFLPKFLFCELPYVVFDLGSFPADDLAEFSRSANLFFLFTACIQQVPGVSPTGRYTTIVPLAVVIIASAFKEIQEDFVSEACCL
jgi:phospholipid-transporting ATPase